MKAKNGGNSNPRNPSQWSGLWLRVTRMPSHLEADVCGASTMWE